MERERYITALMKTAEEIAEKNQIEKAQLNVSQMSDETLYTLHALTEASWRLHLQYSKKGVEDE